MMADDSLESEVAEEEDISPALARQMAREYLEQHYRDTLDQPIPALDGKTPRQAVRSTAGRKNVIDWLKTIENRSARQTGSPVAEYDFGWMWDELGLSDYRNWTSDGSCKNRSKASPPEPID